MIRCTSTNLFFVLSILSAGLALLAGFAYMYSFFFFLHFKQVDIARIDISVYLPLKILKATFWKEISQ